LVAWRSSCQRPPSDRVNGAAPGAAAAPRDCCISCVTKPVRAYPEEGAGSYKRLNKHWRSRVSVDVLIGHRRSVASRRQAQSLYGKYLAEARVRPEAESAGRLKKDKM
jgi:hypothetical protein